MNAKSIEKTNSHCLQITASPRSMNPQFQSPPCLSGIAQFLLQRNSTYHLPDLSLQSAACANKHWPLKGLQHPGQRRNEFSLVHPAPPPSPWDLPAFPSSSLLGLGLVLSRETVKAEEKGSHDEGKGCSRDVPSSFWTSTWSSSALLLSCTDIGRPWERARHWARLGFPSPSVNPLVMSLRLSSCVFASWPSCRRCSDPVWYLPWPSFLQLFQHSSKPSFLHSFLSHYYVYNTSPYLHINTHIHILCQLVCSWSDLTEVDLLS